TVTAGQILGTVQETSRIEHRILVPVHIKSAVVSEIVEPGEYTIEDILATVVLPNGHQEQICMLQRWPIRLPRPVEKRLALKQPLITGLRVIDTLFPLA
ncbi:MAG TPA: V-type ATP synthase subunit A, partial [Sphaerochaeta sp.]|nr:V-type ATP synthase subunit A [Sphaerochaeta sp.]